MVKKIAYLLDEELDSSPGVRRKIVAQTTAWKEQGYEVKIFNLREPDRVRLRSQSTLRKALRHFTSCRRVLQPLRSFNPDFIYTRYIKYAPFFARTLQAIAPYIIEINTNDVTEYGLKNRWHGLYNRMTRGVFFSCASGLISVTNELLGASAFSRFPSPTIVIGNGFDFSSVRLQQSFHTSRSKPALLFIGSAGMPWHGVDKVIRMASLLPEFDFHVIGIPASECVNMKPQNISWHGLQREEDFAHRLLECDVGISSLALHRNNMAEGSPLKSRQYLAYGLPVILGHTDPDLHEGEYILQLENCEDNVEKDIARIRSFVYSMTNANPIEVQETFRPRLDARLKEGRRLAFFESLSAHQHKISRNPVERSEDPNAHRIDRTRT